VTSTNAVDVLHPDWVAALERTGLGVTSPAHAALWAESGRHPIPDQHLELFHRRAAGERLADLGRDVDEHHARVQQILRLTGLRLLAPHLEQIPDWKKAIDRGASYTLIGRAFDVPPDLVRVAFEGWPAPLRHSPEQMLSATKAWREGAEIPDIAAVLGVTPARLAGDINAGRVILGPPRWRTMDVARRLGWVSYVLSKRREEGRLPPPDGRDRAPWWWVTTIEQHITLSGWTWCTQCSRAFVEVRGLRAHLTRCHPDLRQ
jgi:hypothetical protein